MELANLSTVNRLSNAERRTSAKCVFPRMRFRRRAEDASTKFGIDTRQRYEKKKKKASETKNFDRKNIRACKKPRSYLCASDVFVFDLTYKKNRLQYDSEKTVRRYISKKATLRRGRARVVLRGKQFVAKWRGRYFRDRQYVQEGEQVKRAQQCRTSKDTKRPGLREQRRKRKREREKEFLERLCFSPENDFAGYR